MSRNEADTRSQLIDPKLKLSGWSDSRITREHYYQRDRQYTAGRVYLRGNEARRCQGRKVDYLLRYADVFPIAVVEAKAELKSPYAGLDQAKGYARELGVPVAYSTDGHSIIEFDAFARHSRELTDFPEPDELWQRWLTNTGLADVSDPYRLADAQAIYQPDTAIARRLNPLLHPYCPGTLCGKEPRYFQETAIAQIIKRVMRDQRRILLTMATGTGKTFVAFQVVWKLIKSRWLQRLHSDKRPGRVLFLVDRVVLRDQAYNAFSPFATGTSDPRADLQGHPPNLNRDLYFGIYQTLWSEDDQGRRLYECFPHNFFDLVIIDECHRSGFGTWQEMLDHFSEAIHLGMTATPKRSDNVDTYAYFCAEEPEVLIDPDNPGKGICRPPAYEYSLGQGIEDGFLATYKVHRVRTTVDQSGLHVREALEQGAEVYVPEGAELRDAYHTPQFERKITLPDRTRTMADHLARLLHRFGPTEKTMVFCVDIQHARLVAEELNNRFAHLGLDPYARAIISEGGEEARRLLRRFQDSDQKVPVVATTAELLSTGVDVPSCRNVVFMKTLSSPVLFKQIVGRGSRIDPATDKLWFRIIDYTNATRLFDEWDRPPGPPPEAPRGPQTAILEGRVVQEGTSDLIVGASVAVLTSPNTQRGPIYTAEDGVFRFTGLPEGNLTLIVGGAGFRRKQLRVQTLADETVTVAVELKPEGKPVDKIRVEGLEVTIADEAVFLIEATGEQLSLEEYVNHTRWKVIDLTGAEDEFRLREIWVDQNRRRAFLSDLRQASVYVEVLAEVLDQTEADQFDLLAHLAFGAPVRTRSERAAAFINRQGKFMQRHDTPAREVILALLDKYRVGGVEEIADPLVFRLSPFREMGQALGVIRRFGSPERLQETIGEVQRRLYC